MAPLENNGDRKIVRKVLMDVPKGASDVCAPDKCGDDFDNNGRERYIYLVVKPVQSDLVIKLE